MFIAFEVTKNYKILRIFANKNCIEIKVQSVWMDVNIAMSSRWYGGISNRSRFDNEKRQL